MGNVAKTFAWVDLVRTVAERFGPSAAVLVFMLLACKLLGTEATGDEFFRAVVFGEHGWGLPVFTSILLVDVAVGKHLRNRLVRICDSPEKERIIQERNRLQEELLNRKLTHTGKEDDNER